MLVTIVRDLLAPDGPVSWIESCAASAFDAMSDFRNSGNTRAANLSKNDGEADHPHLEVCKNTDASSMGQEDSSSTTGLARVHAIATNAVINACAPEGSRECPHHPRMQP